MATELEIYNKANRVVTLIDIAYSQNTLNTSKVSRISRLLGEIEYTILGDRRGGK